MTAAARPFWHMVFVGLTGVPTFMTAYHYHQLLTQLGLLLVVPIGLFVAGQIALIVWLGNRRNPVLAAIGRAFGTTMQYLALFEGLVLTVLVFYALGGGETGPDPGAFHAEFVIGSLWISVFIYGATGVPALLTRQWIGRVAGIAYTGIAVALPVWLTLFRETAIRDFAASDAGLLVVLALGYFVAMSVVGMWLLMSADPGPADRDGPPPRTGRLPG